MTSLRHRPFTGARLDYPGTRGEEGGNRPETDYLELQELIGR